MLKIIVAMYAAADSTEWSCPHLRAPLVLLLPRVASHQLSAQIRSWTRGSGGVAPALSTLSTHKATRRSPSARRPHPSPRSRRSAHRAHPCSPRHLGDENIPNRETLRLSSARHGAATGKFGEHNNNNTALYCNNSKIPSPSQQHHAISNMAAP